VNRRQVEAQSRRNARLIIKGKDNLKSWGKSGSIYLPRLKKYMKYRSNLERNTFLAVDKISDIVDIQGEPIRIEYWWKGATLNYVPDLICKMKSGLVWILEVKPKSRVDDVRNKAKFRAGVKFCRTNGTHLQFGVVTNPKLVREFLKTHVGFINS